MEYPMQRLTKYGLLLKAILKNTDEDIERENLQTMIKIVDEFVNNVNSSLKHRQDKERLKGIIARIESYDIVETRDDDIEKILKKEKALTQLDLTRPMLNCPTERKRHLLLEGDLKLKDSGTSKDTDPFLYFHNISSKSVYASLDGPVYDFKLVRNQLPSGADLPNDCNTKMYQRMLSRKNKATHLTI